MEIKFENIILRDMIESDIEDYVRWFTTETEWSNTDAPWEPIESDEETERTSWREYYESVKDLPDDVRRWKFEIEWNGRHVGWVYLLRPLTLERGCPTLDRHFSAAAEQADFVGCKLQKTRNLL